jgi:hypothetical protein
VSSDNNSLLATATFDNVSISTGAAPAPNISGISPATGPAGTQVIISGSNFGSSQGSSVVTLRGAPVTVNSWSASSITITIPSAATTGPLMVTVAPSMTNSNPVTFTVTGPPLPAPWVDQDVGSVGPAGSANYANGTFTVNASGQYIWANADGMNFAYQPLSGDGTIVARLLTVQGGSSSESTGVMIRESLNPSSTHMYAAFGQAAIWTVFRATTAGSTTGQSISNITLPYWVKVVRSGNNFSGYGSPDGVNWTQTGTTQTITMAQNVYVGLAVNSGSNSMLATATFDNVSISTNSAPAPSISSISPTTGPAGTQVVISGTNFGASQGSSVVTLSGAPVTVNSWSAASITITIPSAAATGPLVVTVAPSMTNSNPVTFTVTVPPLPAPWLDQDVGPVGPAGSASYANGTFTVNASGQYIWVTSDGMNFAYQPWSGDGTIVARLLTVQGGSSSESSGVMIRESLDPSSAHMYSAFGQAAIWTVVRATTAGSTTGQSISNITLPYWVKVVRSGNNFSGFGSPDGVTWTQIGPTQTIPMAQNVYIGLAVSSDNNSLLATATFDNVTIH